MGLQRQIKISQGRFILETSGMLDTEYAFYLNHRKGTEKLFYSDSRSIISEVPVEPGDYSARFFYKKNGKVSSSTVYFTVDSEMNLYTSEKTSIIDEPGFNMNYYDNNSSKTFIVFNGDGGKKSTAPFGLSFLIKMGFNVLAVGQDNNCYQELSFNRFKELTQPIIKDKKVFLYGSSLGGYCALYYSGAVNGVVIAAAPRNPIHPSIKALTKASGDYDYLHEDMRKVPTTQEKVIVILDPKNEVDSIFFNDVVAPVYPNLRVLESPYAGHEVLMHLNYTGELKKLINDIVSDNTEISLDNTKSSPYKDKTLAQYHIKSENYKKAIYFASRALKDSKKEKLDEILISLIKSSLHRLVS